MKETTYICSNTSTHTDTQTQGRTERRGTCGRCGWTVGWTPWKRVSRPSSKRVRCCVSVPVASGSNLTCSLLCVLVLVCIHIYIYVCVGWMLGAQCLTAGCATALHVLHKPGHFEDNRNSSMYVCAHRFPHDACCLVYVCSQTPYMMPVVWCTCAHRLPT